MHGRATPLHPFLSRRHAARIRESGGQCGELRTSTKTLAFPFSRAEPTPTIDDPITKLYVDPEIGREGFTYVLQSGRTGTVHVEQVLDYNRDPAYLRNLLLYRLSLEAQRRVDESPLSKRELMRRLGTSISSCGRRPPDQASAARAGETMR